MFFSLANKIRNFVKSIFFRFNKIWEEKNGICVGGGWFFTGGGTELIWSFFVLIKFEREKNIFWGENYIKLPFLKFEEKNNFHKTNLDWAEIPKPKQIFYILLCEAYKVEFDFVFPP